jgi:hypothetical protein
MAITIADAFMNQARFALNDTGAVQYWTDTELVGWYNLFRTAVLSEYPNALTKPVKFPLVAGVEQQIPTEDGVTFLRMPANVSGEGISNVSAEAMFDADPDWYAAPPTDLVEHVIPDPQDPLRVRVYPPNTGNGQVWLNYGYDTADATSVNDPFGLTEAYRMPALNCVLGCAWLKNTPRGDRAKAAFHFRQFDAKIAQRIQAEVAEKPLPAQQLKTTE